MRNTWFSFCNYKRSALTVSILGLSLLLPACYFSREYVVMTATDAPAVSPVNDWLYRGPQPAEDFLAALRHKGIKTVVDFRDEPILNEREKKGAESLGMKYVGLPWNIKEPVDPALLDRFFEVLDERENRPVFMHCKHGRDRTGVMATLALMRYERLSEGAARGIALETIHPTPLRQGDVNEKIKFFLKERPDAVCDDCSAVFPKSSPD